MASKSALTLAIALLLGLAPTASAEPVTAPSRESSSSIARLGAATVTATICYWLPRLPGCPIKKGSTL